jgi:hypothetical protein
MGPHQAGFSLEWGESPLVQEHQHAPSSEAVERFWERSGNKGSKERARPTTRRAWAPIKRGFRLNGVRVRWYRSISALNQAKLVSGFGAKRQIHRIGRKGEPDHAASLLSQEHQRTQLSEAGERFWSEATTITMQANLLQQY